MKELKKGSKEFEAYANRAARMGNYEREAFRRASGVSIADDSALNAPADRDVMRTTLEYIATANQSEWDEGQRDSAAFKEWAQSRARHALATAPTPPAEQQGVQEPAAWMFPDDLKKFEVGEHTATAYSIKMGSPDGVTVPLYIHPSPTLAELRAKVEALPVIGVSFIRKDSVLAEIDKLGGKV